ncbi:hypothetical protein Golob_023425 [Gossypium lobatum]|uniref:Uncharacterized protein n=1 Tax=Gossypium lobatum TaxID=34289 RepID=A0A7J8LK13_9ROSI|nr:hypothetical protein [Gossypium lobatum]
MRKINHKVIEIQNKGLGEHRLCDLNDKINKLIRQKVTFGTTRGPAYRYFEATKKLSGVRDLFEKLSKLRKRRTIYDIYKSIDASYYGYKDEEDGVLARVEGPTEAKMRADVTARLLTLIGIVVLGPQIRV